MKRFMLLTASLSALALTACGKQPEPTASATSTEVADIAQATQAAVEAATSAGQTFADTAAASDAFEIATSQLAATKASSAKVKKFADEMVKAHTASTAKLKDIAAQATPAITPNPAMTAAQQQTLTDLGTKSGADFDTAYAAAQVDGHEKTLATLKAYAAQGDVDSLKTFAAGLVPVVTAHLNMAKSL